jgi:hypothetical protein
MPSSLKPYASLGLMIIAFVVLTTALISRLSPAPPVRVSLPYSEDFTDSKRLGWNSINGSWEVTDGEMYQSRVVGTDLSIVSPVFIEPATPYRFEARTRRRAGDLGSGLVFNVRDGVGQLIRFTTQKTGVYLMYGYFDESGQYQGQGSVLVGLSTENDGWHKLGVVVGPQHYYIELNDRIVTDSVALKYKGGAVGLTTTGTAASFDDLRVALLDNAEIAAFTSSQSAVPVGLDLAVPGVLRVVRGTWLARPPSTVTQADTNSVDFVVTTGINAERYEAAIEVSFPDDDNDKVGRAGGLVFNMRDRKTLQQAQGVRITQSGAVEWGEFDVEGNFKAIGAASLEKPQAAAFLLSIKVLPETYTIYVDGVMIIEQPLPTKTGGWIGLFSTSGPVVFRKFDWKLS